MSDVHALLTNPDIWVQIIGPGGLLLTLVGGAVRIFRGQRRRVQAQGGDGDVVAQAFVERLSVLERRVRALVDLAMRQDRWADDHPCTHVPPHPRSSLPLDVLLGVQTQTPASGMPTIPSPRLES